MGRQGVNVGQNDRVTTIRRPVAQQVRRRLAVALAATAVLAAGLLIVREQTAAAVAPHLPAAAAPHLAAAAARAADAAPATTSNAGGAKLVVNPANGLPSTGGSLAVSGSGFSTTAGLYVAICHADGKAPASLKDCVGGAIPDSNSSSSWAHVTANGAPPATGGPVAATWAAGGAFSVHLTLPASNTASDALDCSKVVCAVYTRPDKGGDKSQELSIPLTFQALPATTTPATTTPATTTPATTTPPSSSTRTTTTPSTTTTSTSTSSSSSSASSTKSTVSSTTAPSSTVRTATTVRPKLIQSDPVAVGAVQEVLFGGFDKGETVLVTLYFAPRKLPAVTADQDGIVTVRFTVPADLPVSAHLLQVVGQTSKVTGVASFEVMAAPVVSSAVISSSAPVSTTAASVSVSSAPVASSAVAPVVPPTFSSSAPASSPAAPVPPAPASSGSKPVWPWYLLGLIVLLAIGFALWALQRRRDRLAAELREKDRLLAEGAAAEQDRAAGAIARANADAPTDYIGPRATGRSDGYTGFDPGEHGLLSGRDNPDNPGLLSGHGYRQGDTAEPPTTYLPPQQPSVDQPTRYAPPPAHPLDSGPAVSSAPGADSGTGVDSGPHTSTWRPDFDDGDDGDHDRPDGDRPDGGRPDGGRPDGGRHSR